MKLKVNIQNIEAETEKAILIKCTKKSGLSNYGFWVPKRFVNTGSHSYEMEIWFGDDFKINLKYLGKSKQPDREITAQRLAEVF